MSTSLDVHRELLITLKQEGQTYQTMIGVLAGIDCITSERSLRRYFADLGLTNSSTIVTPQLVDQVKDLFLHQRLSDTQTG
jgi:hypothetical protein